MNDTPAAQSGAGRSDRALVDAVRSGDRDAYGVLWERHAAAGRRYAAAMTRAFDADDLASEAYVRIYAAIQAGKGPTGSFRPYLLVSIRNIAISWAKQRREGPLEDADEIADPRATDAGVLATVDANLTARAFRTLPDRWQEVLWLTEVEGMATADVAARFGMTVSGVGMLALRAREGLRQAWIQAHIDTSGMGSEHHWALQHVGQNARGKLRARAKTKFDAHLAGCAACTVIAAEAIDTSNQFALTLVPLAVGVLGVSSLGAFLQAATGADAAHAETGAAPADRLRTTSHTNRRGTVLLIAGAAALVALTGAAIGNAVSIDRPSAQRAVPATSDASSTTVPAPSSNRPTKATSASAPTMSASPQPSSTATRQPRAKPTRAPNPPAATPSTPGNTWPTLPGPLVPTPQTPIITLVDTESGTLYPTVQGTARPDSQVVVSSSQSAVTAATDSSGRWQVPALQTNTGTVKITATADGLTSTPSMVQVATPEVFAAISAQTIAVTVRGSANTSYAVRWDGSTVGVIRTDASGNKSLRLPNSDPAAAHTIAVNAVSGNRVGPPISISIAPQR